MSRECHRMVRMCVCVTQISRTRCGRTVGHTAFVLGSFERWTLLVQLGIKCFGMSGGLAILVLKWPLRRKSRSIPKWSTRLLHHRSRVQIPPSKGKLESTFPMDKMDNRRILTHFYNCFSSPLVTALSVNQCFSKRLHRCVIYDGKLIKQCNLRTVHFA